MKAELDYVPVNTKRYDDGVLLTNDYGNWLFLTNDEYKQYKFRDMEPELVQKLKENLMVVNAGNIDSLTHQLDEFNWYTKSGTQLHIVVPTLRCDLTCRYCYAFRETADKRDKDMTPETMDATIDFILKTPSDKVTIEFTGGEPLMRFDLIKRAITRAESKKKEFNKDVHYALITNALHLNDEVVDYLIENREKISVCLSLDGPEYIHNHNRIITGTKDSSYAVTLKGIEKLKEKRYPSMTAMPVITRKSIENWKDVVDEYIRQGFGVLRYKYVSRFGYASQAWEQEGYDADEFLDAWKKVVNYILEKNKHGVQITEQLTTLIIVKLLKGYNTNYAEMTNPCGAVVTQVVYNYDGNIYPCDESRTNADFKIGTVFDSKYDDLLNHPVSKTMMSISNLSSYGCDDKCPWTPYCGICPFEVYEEKKGFVANINANYRHKIHKGMFDFIMNKILHNPEERKLLSRWPDVYPGIPELYEMDEDVRNKFADYISQE